MEYLKKLYKTKSNEELISILENKEDYQEKAVIVAQEELTSRNLSESDIQNAHQIIEEKKKQEIQNKINRKKNISIYEAPIIKILSILNPFENEISIHRKFIFYVSLYLILIPVYKFYTDYDFIKYEFSSSPKVLMQMLIYYGPYLLYFIAGILFVLHHKAGWYLTTGIVIFSIELTIIMLLKFGLGESSAGGWNLIANIISGYFLVSAIIAGVILYTLLSLGVSEIFQIQKKEKYKTIIVSTLSVIYFYTKFVHNL